MDLSVAVILFLGSALQGALGFALGLFSIPLLLATGRSLPTTIAILMTTAMVLSLVAVREFRSSIPWRDVVGAATLRSLTIPVGVAALVLINADGRHTVKLVVGVAILVVVALQAFGRPPSSERVERLRAPACLVSGFTLGMIGIGGPPLVLWVMATGWPARKIRAFLLSVYLLSLPLALGVLAWRLGPDLLLTAAHSLVYAPVVVVGATCGLRLGHAVSKPRLRAVALVLLTIIGITTLA